MNQRTISTSLVPEIIIDQVHGNLDLKGWDAAQVELRASPETLEVQEGADQLRISCQGNLEVRLPQGADVQVLLVHGQARLRRLEEPLRIGAVHGSLSVRDVATTKIDVVHGELTARDILGDLQVGRVLGNAYLRNIRGDCTLEQVDGKLDLHSLGGSFKAVAEGNVQFGLEEAAGESYQIQAAGNIYLKLPPNANLHLQLDCDGSITVRLPGQTQTAIRESYTLVLGDGRARFAARAAGSIFITSQEPEWAQPGETDPDPDFTRISEDIGRQVEAMTRQVNEQMGRLSAELGRAGLSDAHVDSIVEKARRSSERAQGRAEEKMRQAQEKMARTQEKMQRKMEYQNRRDSMRIRPPVPPVPPVPPRPPAGFGWTTTSRPPVTPPGDPVSEEERDRKSVV